MRGNAMTILTSASGQKYIKWDVGDPVDYRTPDFYPDEGGGHIYCGNCGLDVPGCGCPRDPNSPRYLEGYPEDDS
jgi:hypothetical protein